MRQKIVDTSPTISNGGRLKEYWDGRGIRQRRSSGMEWDGQEINLRDLIDRYNLKGFDFGRYVNNEDRYDFVIGTRESLKDLAWLLKSDNVGIERKVGVAFGARGRGGRAAAHYEPCANMINLTKRRGASALAHEYGHALDYNIGTYVDQNRRYRALSGGRSTAAFLDDNTGGTVRLLMRRLISEIKDTGSFARLKKASDYWHYNTEVFARYFEQWCCYMLREANKSNHFLTEAWTSYTNSPAYLTEADFKKTLPLGNKLMKNIGLLLNGKATEKYEDPGTEKKEPVRKPIAKPEPKKAAASAGTKKTAPTRKAKTGKLLYQDYAKAFESLSRMTQKNPVSMYLACVFHDKGDMVSTDTHIMGIIHDADYPKQKEGKAVLARKVKPGNIGDVLDVKYPNFRAVIPSRKSLDKGMAVNVDTELKKAKKVNAKVRELKGEAKKKFKSKYEQKLYLEENGVRGSGEGSFIPVKFGKHTVNSKLLQTSLAFLSDAGAQTAVYYNNSINPSNKAGILRSGNLEVLIMPVMSN